jgi:hypothetical protein
MPFTPLLPSQLLLGSPFQPGTPAIAQFGAFPTTPPGSQYPAVAAAANYLQHQYYSSQFELENHSRTVCFDLLDPRSFGGFLFGLSAPFGMGVHKLMGSSLLRELLDD